MSVRRFGVLLANELAHGARGFLVVSILVPVLISLLTSLLFGSLFSSRPRLGVVDQGRSAVLAEVRSLSSISVRSYADGAALETAVRAGSVDIGIVLPAGFDAQVRAGSTARLSALTWGESLARNRLLIGTVLSRAVRRLAGQGSPVQIQTVLLGDAASIPWTDRLLPLVILMTVFLGGIFIPATSLIDEKEKRTLQALLVTPARAGEVFAAKGVVAASVCLLMGVVVLVLNAAYGHHPWLLTMAIALGTLMAVTIGLLLGVVLKEVSTLFALWKSAAIVLFGPAVVYLFPRIPQWIGKIFPTYYLLEPIVQIGQRGGGWPQVSRDILVLAGIDAALLVLLAVALRGAQRRQALA